MNLEVRFCISSQLHHQPSFQQPSSLASPSWGIPVTALKSFWPLNKPSIRKIIFFGTIEIPVYSQRRPTWLTRLYPFRPSPIYVRTISAGSHAISTLLYLLLILALSTIGKCAFAWDTSSKVCRGLHSPSSWISLFIGSCSAVFSGAITSIQISEHGTWCVD